MIGQHLNKLRGPNGELAGKVLDTAALIGSTALPIGVC